MNSETHALSMQPIWHYCFYDDGLDIAKSVFQVHGVDAAGQVLIRRRLKRRPSWRSSRNCQYVWLGSRLAPRRTTGCASSSTRPFGAVDAAGLREALRQASEE